MEWAIAIQETRAVGKISRRRNMEGKGGPKSGAERVALVVIEIAEAAAVAKLSGLGEQSSSDDSGAFDLLIRIRKVNVETFFDERTQSGFPTMNSSAFYGQREKDIGIAEHIMIKEINGMRLEIRKIQ